MKKHKKDHNCFACFYKTLLETTGKTILCILFSAIITALIYGNYIACTQAFWHEDFQIVDPWQMTLGVTALTADFFLLIWGIGMSYDWADKNC